MSTGEWRLVSHSYQAERDDELSLVEGEAVQVVAAGPGGWWRGRAAHRSGVFPANHTSPLRPEDVTGPRPGQRVTALHSYQPARPDELALQAGEQLVVTGEAEPGWWRGRNAYNAVGLFPSNHVAEPAATESPAVMRRGSHHLAQPAGSQQNLGGGGAQADRPGLQTTQEDELGPLCGSLASQLDGEAWSTASVGSFTEARPGLLGRLKLSLSTKSLFPNFLSRRLSSSSLYAEKPGVERGSSWRRKSFAAFFSSQPAALSRPSLRGSSGARKMERTSRSCDQPGLARAGQNKSEGRLAAGRAGRDPEQCSSWVWHQDTGLVKESEDSGRGGSKLSAPEEIFGPVFDMTDEVFVDMFENKKVEEPPTLPVREKRSSKASKIRTSLTSAINISNLKRNPIPTNPKTAWSPKGKFTEL